ncbi:2Fe-2S iron-sulfur cluster-binding protein [Mesobacterium sp. TK19101]|uniref:2Fe-2S iron-sulfur cluster-binding protein n=1 Tax=Mesobacterium hydrothermale TaxID=3111907 RepID=A0ABU6HJ74_9RHOB|nr:2Fe-2S iron-sulfur cluster-binding protein [Mesobacterium sp. TK19101]MEC3862432.1 2Fe-2S iron-sulfur cluster-binding protein [Mesobacterium sp. TK19101]
MIKLSFVTSDGQEITTTARAGISLMEAARAANIPGILAECGGACSCSTCHVYVDRDWIGKLPGKAEDEADLLDFAFEPDEETSRLSCQVTLTPELDGMRVMVPERQG